MRVVCITGQAGHGKSTAERALNAAGYKSMMLALPIKKTLVGLSRLLPSVFESGPLTLEQCNEEATKATQLLTPEAVTNRYMMQQIGDVLKDAFGDSDLFARTVMAMIAKDPSSNYVIPDVRSVEELRVISALLKETELFVLRVDAPSVGKVGSCALGDTAVHWTETKVSGVPHDTVLVNQMDGEAKFHAAVVAAVDGHFAEDTVVVAASVMGQYIVTAPGGSKTMDVTVKPSVVSTASPPPVSSWTGSVWLPLQNTPQGPAVFQFDPSANKKLVGQVKDQEQQGVVFYITLTATDSETYTLDVSTQQPQAPPKKNPLFTKKAIRTMILFGEAAGVIVGALVLFAVVATVARAMGRKHRKKLEEEVLDEAGQEYVVFDCCGCLRNEDKLVCRACMDAYMAVNRSRLCFFCRVPFDTIFQAGWQPLVSKLHVFHDKQVPLLAGPPDEALMEALIEDGDEDAFASDVDENGDLEGFIVGDDEVEYDSDYNPSSDEDDE